MKIKGVGIDIIEIRRVGKAAENPRFFEKMFTEREMEFFRSRNMNISTIAASFAAKEAYVKALGTGFGGESPKSVEILRDDKGKPFIVSDRKDMNFFVSVSHCRDYAVAQIIAAQREEDIT